MAIEDVLKKFKAMGTNDKARVGGRTKTVEDHRKYVSKYIKGQAKELQKAGKSECARFIEGQWHIKVVMQSKWLKLDGKNDVQKIVGTKNDVADFLTATSIEIMKGTMDSQLSKHMADIRAMKQKANAKQKKK